MSVGGDNTLREITLSQQSGASAAEGAFTFRREIVRKLVHVTGLAVPAIYYFVPRTTAMMILAAISITGIVLDSIRYRHEKTMQAFERWFGRVLRAHEKDVHGRHLNAVTWFFIAATISVAVFPKYITAISIVVALFGDAASALIGRRFGRARFHGKSVEGSTAFFVVALLTAWLFPKIGHGWEEYLIGAGAALVGTFAELTPAEIVDDNFIVPLSIAGSMWLLYRLLLPGANLHYGI